MYKYTPGVVFVFGSNLAGVHGAGAAKFALDHYGAVPGQGRGRQGMSYAIPTKGRTLLPLTLGMVSDEVQRFILYAMRNPAEEFHVTKVGCGLAGFMEADIAPMFLGAPDNCMLPINWRK